METINTVSTEKSIQNQYTHGPIHILKQMGWYVGFSLLITIPGLIVMILSVMHYPTHSPLRLGLDFTGGTLLQYGFEKQLDQDKDIPTMRNALDQIGIHNAVIQLQKAQAGMVGVAHTSTPAQPAAASKQTPDDNAGKKQSVSQMFKDSAAADKPDAPKQQAVKSIVSIRTQDLTTQKTVALQTALQNQFGNYSLLQKNRVGPTLARELFIKAAIGLIVAYGVIIAYLAIRFQLDYAVMAIIALLHDTVFMLGAFSILGWFFKVEVDSMFVTAILTVVGFSVHDTIVVFDRIRENARVLFTKKLPFHQIVDISVNQTLARSINTSLTALLTLLALYFFGGESTRNFVLAMILGIVVGTYSSIFVASSLLTWWRVRHGEQPAQRHVA